VELYLARKFIVVYYPGNPLFSLFIFDVYPTGHCNNQHVNWALSEGTINPSFFFILCRNYGVEFVLFKFNV